MTTIGQLTFRTTKAAEGHIRDILGRYKQRESLSGEDYTFVAAILASHPHSKTVIDCGIKRIEVQHLGDGSRRFLLVRTDSSFRDFTWRHAVYPRSAKQSAMRACRVAIRPQVDDFRRAFFADAEPKQCPVLGLPISATDSHVDHQFPNTFETLVERWLKANNITYEDIDLEPHPGYQQPDQWVDSFLRENWIQFHLEFATLRVISATANLGEAKTSGR